MEALQDQERLKDQSTADHLKVIRAAEHHQPQEAIPGNHQAEVHQEVLILEEAAEAADLHLTLEAADHREAVHPETFHPEAVHQEVVVHHQGVVEEAVAEGDNPPS